MMALGDSGCAFGSTHVSPPAYPEPTILEIANVLYCDIVGTWQWYFSGMLIPGATDQSIVPDANGTYTVEVTLTTGCAGVSEPYPVADVGLGGVTAEVPKMRLSIDDGHLTLIGANAPLHFRLFDMSGRLVEQRIVLSDPWGLDISALPSGLYIARVGGEAVRITR